jgi:hypothetical protein
MSNKPIRDAQTRAKSVQRLREIVLMFDALNTTLDAAIASAEADLRNSPHQIRKQI